MGYLLSSLYGRTEIFYIGCHSLLGDGFPRFFQQQDLAHALQPPHLGEEGFHNDDRHHGQQRAVFGDVIQLEDDEPLVQQIHLTVRVEQVVVLSAPVERFEDVQEVRPIEILLTNLLLLQQPSVVGGDELVEGVERRYDGGIALDLDRKSTRLNSSHIEESRMPSSA